MHAGCVIVAGRPNVGKSTLFNRLLGTNLSIATPKPNTTRYCIRGIIDDEDSQLVLIDTPGCRRPGRSKMGRHLSNAASMPPADMAVLLVEASGLRPADKQALALLPDDLPVIAGINKADRVRSQDRLLPVAAKLDAWRDWHAILPLSARTGDGCDELLHELRGMLPAAEKKMYPAGARSDRKDAFFIADFIREQILLLLDDEVPYAVGVEIRALEREGRMTRVVADILVDTRSRQAMIVGTGGRMLKRIGTRARRAIERYLGRRVYLDLHVRHRSNWLREPAQLARLGLEGGIV